MATKLLAKVEYEQWSEEYKARLRDVVKTKIEEAVAKAVQDLIVETINTTAEQKAVEELTTGAPPQPSSKNPKIPTENTDN